MRLPATKDRTFFPRASAHVVTMSKHCNIGVICNLFESSGRAAKSCPPIAPRGDSASAKDTENVG